MDGFILGDKIQDGDFKNAIIDALIAPVLTIGGEEKCSYPSERWWTLRRLLIDIHVHDGCRNWVEDGAGPDFLIDFVRDLLDVCNVSHMPDPTSQHVSSCPYHHHRDDVQ